MFGGGVEPIEYGWNNGQIEVHLAVFNFFLFFFFQSSLLTSSSLLYLTSNIMKSAPSSKSNHPPSIGGADALSSPPPPPALRSLPVRLGLVNASSTCFLNCILQCLLASPKIFGQFIIVNDAIRRAKEVESEMGGEGGGSEFIPPAAHTTTNTPTLEQLMPVTHEMMRFVNQCIIAAPPKPKRRTQKTQRDGDNDAVNGDSADASAATSASLTSTADNAATPALSSSNDTSSSTSTTQSSSSISDARSVANAAPTLPSSSSTTSLSKPSSDVPKPRNNKKKQSSKSKSLAPLKAADEDHSFLDALAAGDDSVLDPAAAKAAQEEERRKAKNKKLREKEKAKAKLKEMKTKEEEVVEIKQSEEDNKEEKKSDAADVAAADADSTMQISDQLTEMKIESDQTSTEQPKDGQQGKKKKKKKNKPIDATAAAENTQEVVPPTSTTVPSPPSPPQAPASPILEPTQPPAEPSSTDASSSSSSSNSTSTIRPLPKSARVHRVQDEEEWIIHVKPSKHNKKQNQPQKKQDKHKQQQQQSTKQAAPVNQTQPASTSVPIASSQPSASAPPPSYPSLLPSFPHLLRSFRHRHSTTNSHEDAAELLHLLCENLQQEWIKARNNKNVELDQIMKQIVKENKEMQNEEDQTSIYDLDFSATDDSSPVTADDDWTDIGKGSKAIRVSSRVTFDPTPISRVFCGRLRAELAVGSSSSSSSSSAAAARTSTQSMSLQPFWMISLDIQPGYEEEQQQPQKQTKQKTIGSATITRPPPSKPMSVERAFARFMHPSEVVGFRKRGTPAPSSSSYDYGYGYSGSSYSTPSHRALHSHSLDPHSLPLVLVFQLKRFEESHSTTTGFAVSPRWIKNETHVKFYDCFKLVENIIIPINSNNQNANSATTNDKKKLGMPSSSTAVPTYDLTGVVVHHGHQLHGGHYTAYVKDHSADVAESDHSADSSSSPSTWFHCDDTRITPVAAHTVFAQQAYLLFYTKRSDHRR